MPIRPENKSKYPPDWKQISARIKERDGNRCKFCGVENYAWGYRQNGEFMIVSKELFQEAGYKNPPFNYVDVDGRTFHIIKIVLTVAHLNHDETDCSDDNLKALCQQCHNRYDVKHRRQGIIQRKNKQEVLF